MAGKQFTAAEVAQHNSESSAWVIINGGIYDLTRFLDKHPGGKKILIRVLGQDASAQFAQFHNVEQVLGKFGPQLKIGEVASALPVAGAKKDAAPSKAGSALYRGEGDYMGSMIPFVDPMWQQDWYSPYYKESHFRLARFCRDFVEREVAPNVETWEENLGVTPEIYKRYGDLGLLALEHAPGIYKYLPSNFPRPAGLKDNEIDDFHKIVARYEYMKVGSRGVVNGLFAGVVIALSPVLHGATEAIKQRVVPDVVTGNNWCCLAITEPETGSDTANITTTARLTDDGKHYIVNGTKKWITNAIWAKYFITAVRTGGPGASGVSMLLVERPPADKAAEMGVIKTTKMKLQGGWASGTTFVSFEDVKVPVENILGKVNDGFKLLMYNFNFERIFNICSSVFASRAAYEEAVKYAHKRRTFGKLLIEHPVIRAKLANMARQIEAAHAWLELQVYQFTQFKDYKLLNDRIGGAVALMKAHGSITCEYVAREAAQIFGGLAYTRGGQGGKVERIYRDVRAYAIPAGSEEIMLDFGIRDSLKKAVVLQAPIPGVKF